ncbi:hypothetical protein TcWFU_009800 [Taenia crassiceps]|uniref:Uncharacterized protein n=1 Tax=Taenia crassiceps TaxID=6207 RepID=A0ABR4Q8F2_9CEST
MDMRSRNSNPPPFVRLTPIAMSTQRVGSLRTSLDTTDGVSEGIQSFGNLVHHWQAEGAHWNVWKPSRHILRTIWEAKH